jgi:hypothetical protein
MEMFRQTMLNEKHWVRLPRGTLRAKKPSGIGRNRRCTRFHAAKAQYSKEFGFIEVVNGGIV